MTKITNEGLSHSGNIGHERVNISEENDVIVLIRYSMNMYEWRGLDRPDLFPGLARFLLLSNL